VIHGSRRTHLLALVALLLAPAGLARAEVTTWYAETLTSSPRGLQVTSYWSRGNGLLRAETVIAGHRLVTIVNGPTYFAIDETAGSVVAIERSKRAREEGVKHDRLMGLEGFVIRERGGEKVGEETVGGRPCSVYRLTDERGKREVWVHQGDEDVLPVRVEFYNRQAGALIRTDYIQWASGIELPDRLFAPDPRFPVRKLGYEEYVAQSGKGELLVPVLHANLLHGGEP